MKINTVLLLTDCKKHDAPIGNPCWSYTGGHTQKTHIAICNDRALRAGFVGKISSQPTKLSPNRKVSA